MILRDRRMLAKLMAIQQVSQRTLARDGAGWKSHAYLGALLRGEKRTVTPVAAARIAAYLGVGIDDLFIPRMSGGARHDVPAGPNARRVA